MEFTRFVRAIRKSWWLVALLMIASGGAALLYSNSQAPVYASHLKFYVGSPSIDDSSANSTNQFAQDRATSYASLVSSDSLAKRIAGRPGLPSAGVISSDISASAQLNTVLIDVTVQDTSRKQAYAIANAVGETFPTLVDELDNTRTGGGATVKLSVVSGPSSSGVPISPRTNLNVALGIAAGLLLGLLIAAAREVLDNSARSPEVLAELAGVPVLGVVGYERSISAHPLIIGDMSGSPRAEAVRRIRTNLRFIGATGQARIVVVTSSVEGEGKSTISVNLALSIAESGRSVLLIEGDLRRPGVSPLMNIEGSVGLTNVLVGQTSLEDVLQPWGSSGLTVLPSGTQPPNPAELLGSPRMRELLATLSARFDVVLIDSPPLLPVTDPALLAAQADGAIVVFRHGRTRRSQLAYALEQLDSVDARVIGTVLNMRPSSRSDRRGYGHYYETENASTRWWRFRRQQTSLPVLPKETFERAVTAAPLPTTSADVLHSDADTTVDVTTAAALDGAAAFDPQPAGEAVLDRGRVLSQVAARRSRRRQAPRRRIPLELPASSALDSDAVLDGDAVLDSDVSLKSDDALVSGASPNGDADVDEAAARERDAVDSVADDDAAYADGGVVDDTAVDDTAVEDGARAVTLVRDDSAGRPDERFGRENKSRRRTRTRHDSASRDRRAPRHHGVQPDDDSSVSLADQLFDGEPAHRA